MKLEDIVAERVEAPEVGDSGIMDVVSKNIRRTDKFGGPVRFSVVRKRVSAAVGDPGDSDLHWIKASLTAGANNAVEWKVLNAQGKGVERAIRGRKLLNDAEMTAAVQAVFDFAKKRK